MNIIQAIRDPQLFKPFLGKLDTWQPWMTAMRCLYGLPIKGETARELVHECTGRDPANLPPEGFSTALFLTGRRSGKSRIAAIVGAYEAALAAHETKLAKGEKGIVLIASPTKSQSRIVRDYIRAIFDVPILAGEIVSETREGFELSNGNRIEILAGDWRTVRGYTLIAAIIDEVCFFGYDAESKVKSDSELVRAIKPSLATVQGKLVCISSPYAPRGWSYSQFKRNFGNDEGRVLVWNCASRVMNETLSQAIVDEALQEDFQSARAEYLGMFRDDISTFISRDTVDKLVVLGRTELAPRGGIHYCGFVDLSGGRIDDAALGIAHREGPTTVLDLVLRFRPPFNPNDVIAEMVRVINRYGIRDVGGDSYAAEFVKMGFESRGIGYQRRNQSEWSKFPTAETRKPKSQLYLELLPRLNAGQVELLDNTVLIDQLCALERKTTSGGRDKIDHPPNAHDDLCNILAGVVDQTVQKGVHVIGGRKNGLHREDISPMDSVNADFSRRQAEYARDQEILNEPDDPSEGLYQALGEKLREQREQLRSTNKPFSI